MLPSWIAFAANCWLFDYGFQRWAYIEFRLLSVIHVFKLLSIFRPCIQVSWFGDDSSGPVAVNRNDGIAGFVNKFVVGD